VKNRSKLVSPKILNRKSISNANNFDRRQCSFEIFTTRLDFADCYLISLAKAENIEIFTFDKKLMNQLKR
jgi:predicted nucleic acid-binding protein